MMTNFFYLFDYPPRYQLFPTVGFQIITEGRSTEDSPGLIGEQYLRIESKVTGADCNFYFDPIFARQAEPFWLPAR
jgi:hypothetical protein